MRSEICDQRSMLHKIDDFFFSREIKTWETTEKNFYWGIMVMKKKRHVWEKMYTISLNGEKAETVEKNEKSWIKWQKSWKKCEKVGKKRQKVEKNEKSCKREEK